jgi:hypothetical protein
MIPDFTSKIDARTKADSKYYTNRDVGLIEQGTIWNDPSKTFLETTTMLVDLRRRSKAKSRRNKQRLWRVIGKVNRVSKELKRILEKIMKAGQLAFPNDLPSNPLQPKTLKDSASNFEAFEVSEPLMAMWKKLSEDDIDEENLENADEEMPSLPKHPEVSCNDLTDKELEVCEAFEEYYSGLREVVRSRMELLRLDKEKFNKTLPCLRTLGVEAINLDKSFGILMKNFEVCMAAAHYDV